MAFWMWAVSWLYGFQPTVKGVSCALPFFTSIFAFFPEGASYTRRKRAERNKN